MYLTLLRHLHLNCMRSDEIWHHKVGEIFHSILNRQRLKQSQSSQCIGQIQALATSHHFGLLWRWRSTCWLHVYRDVVGWWCWSRNTVYHDAVDTFNSSHGDTNTSTTTLRRSQHTVRDRQTFLKKQKQTNFTPRFLGVTHKSQWSRFLILIDFSCTKPVNQWSYGPTVIRLWGHNIEYYKPLSGSIQLDI